MAWDTILKDNEWLQILQNSVEGKTLSRAERVEYANKQKELMGLISDEKEGKEVTLPDWFLKLRAFFRDFD